MAQQAPANLASCAVETRITPSLLGKRVDASHRQPSHVTVTGSIHLRKAGPYPGAGHGPAFGLLTCAYRFLRHNTKAL
jgi:hypothetical protein